MTATEAMQRDATWRMPPIVRFLIARERSLVIRKESDDTLFGISLPPRPGPSLVELLPVSHPSKENEMRAAARC
jgi:hypothetical protein